MKAAFVDIDGARTRYLHEGDGPPLLMLQGVGLSGDIFIRNIDVLARRFRVVAPDFPGHGFSDSIDFKGGPPQPATVRHLNKLVDRLGFERYSIVGSSYGGLIAALMWFDRPTRVDRLVIAGSGAVFHPPDEQEATLRGAYGNAVATLGDPTLETCRRRMANICFSPTSVASEILPLQLTSYALPDRLEAYRETLSGLIETVTSVEHRVYSRLEHLAARTLTIVGREDIRAKWELHRDGCRRMPSADCVIFEQCGHLPYMEHPDRFNGLVAEFLSG
jgi:pimeloyl-ACP methyl ester carboxylesterase